MLTEERITELRSIVNRSLDRCEELWANTLAKDKLVKNAAFSETHIPGCKYLGEDEYKSDYFIALMLDVRDSTTHLRQAISHKIAKVSQMQRVYYEVSALLPAMATVIQHHDGSVVEYLGDGLLALFQFPVDDRGKVSSVTSAVSLASQECIYALEKVVNPILFTRYGLPSLKIGIGLACSQAIISHFGIKPQSQVKVIGECIYLASNLSRGDNTIEVHKDLEALWPTSKGGKLRFKPVYRGSKNDIEAFELTKEN